MPCRQLRPSSRREHVRASNSQMGWMGKLGKKEKKGEKEKNPLKVTLKSNTRKTHKSLYSAAAFKNSKITSGLTVLKRSCKEGTWSNL